jgi:sugar lactone lactonase YvrE
VEVVASGYQLPEAPRVDADGAFWFTDVLGGGVHRLDPPATLLERHKGMGGCIPHENGGLVLAGRDLIHVQEADPTVVLSVEGVSGFVDLTTDAEGRVLVGGLRFFPFRGEEAVPGGVWRVGPGGAAELLFEDVLWPNGMGYSPDGSTLYVSDYSQAAVLAWDGESVAELARPPRGSCDGLAVDADGGVWVALGEGAAIARFAPDGEIDSLLEVPANFVSSLCLHGPDLWITAVGDEGGVVLRTDAPASGLELVPARV